MGDHRLRIHARGSVEAVCVDPRRHPDGFALLSRLRRRQQRRARAHHDRSPVRRRLCSAAGLRLRARPSRTRSAVPHHAAAGGRPAVRGAQLSERVQDFLDGVLFVRPHPDEVAQTRFGERRPERDSACVCADRRHDLGLAAARSGARDHRQSRRERPAARPARGAQARHRTRAPSSVTAAIRSCTWTTIRKT